MLGPIKNVQEILAKNAELTARLKVADEQNRRLQEENQRLQSLEPQNKHLSERVLLLEEEVRWFKEQYFGRSSQKSASQSSPDQRMLFNEAEVLAAIDEAEAAHAARTTQISAHERKRGDGGREPIPEHLPRKQIVHDLPNPQKYCEHEGTCWEMDCIDREVSERYHYESPKIWVAQHVRLKRAVWPLPPGCPHC